MKCARMIDTKLVNVCSVSLLDTVHDLLVGLGIWEIGLVRVGNVSIKSALTFEFEHMLKIVALVEFSSDSFVGFNMQHFIVAFGESSFF